jgi:acyl phosphate:glycerol-3-phosphate acyltransferase
MIGMLVFAAIAYLSGSIPFSVIIGQMALRSDIRAVGDGNPGAANAWKAGGWRVGIAAMLADFFKGALPVGVFHFLIPHEAWQIIPVAIAPMLGHAYPIFLNFKGGKALAVTFGTWAGLTLGEAPIVLGLLFAVLVVSLRSNAWAVMIGMGGLLAHLVMRDAYWTLIAIWVLNMTILAWKHRRELALDVRMRSALYARVEQVE